MLFNRAFLIVPYRRCRLGSYEKLYRLISYNIVYNNVVSSDAVKSESKLTAHYLTTNKSLSGLNFTQLLGTQR